MTAHRIYMGCPRQWWLVNVVKVEQNADSANNRGVLLHAGLAAGYAECDRARNEGVLPAVIRRWVENAVDEAVTVTAERMGYVEDTDEAYGAVMHTLTHLAPQRGDRVLGVEREMVIEVDGVTIVYRADVLYRRDKTVVVRDWKSSSEVPRSRDLSGNLQLGLGALCAAREFSTTEVAVEIASIGRAVAVSARVDAATARDAGIQVAESAQHAAVDTAFEPTPGEVCAKCPVRRHCPVFATKGSDGWIPAPDGKGGVGSLVRLDIRMVAP